MQKSQINPMPEYFDYYINLAHDLPLTESFQASLDELEQLDINFLNQIGNKTYQPEKWIIKDIFQHLLDVERILSYRALHFARQEETKPAGFTVGLMAKNAGAEKREITDLINEMISVRKATSFLFQSFDDKALLHKGLNGGDVSALAMGFTIIGHQIHHLKVIEERYYPLFK